jgi:oligoendopeptidase F
MTSKLAVQTEEFLPRWNLTDFYQSPEDHEISKDLQNAESLAQKFVSRYKDKFTADSSWEPAHLLQSIQDYEQIDELLSKLGSYGYLCFATNVNNPSILQFFQMIQEKCTSIYSHLIFYTLALNQITQPDMDKACQICHELNKYKPWIDNVRLFQEHLLSPDIEKLLHEKSITGQTAWIRLYDETLSGIKFLLNGQELPLADILNQMGNKDAIARKEAAMALSKGLTAILPVLCLVTNTLAKDKEIEDTWRKYPHPVSSRNLSNQVEGEVVNALVKTVKENYSCLSHRYYTLKAKWLGLEKLEYWDRNAPLPDADDTHISWADARDIVLHAYEAFHPEMAKIGSRFFENNWIDVPSQAGKESGAFSHPTVPGVHPYILLNFHGKLRDVMTLAHELGHGIHQVLAAEQGHLLSSTPLTIAETASVFGEMLTFKALLAKADSPLQRRSLMASKVDDMINTVVRQIAFFEFEKSVHEQRRKGELSAEDIAAIWMQTQGEALGDAVNLDPAIKPFWGYVSHFIHSPFYVYAYAFGDCLVNSLYGVYETGLQGFPELYLELLKAGGTKRYNELLQPFNLDARNPSFWQKGLNVITHLIDELEQI